MTIDDVSARRAIPANRNSSSHGLQDLEIQKWISRQYGFVPERLDSALQRAVRPCSAGNRAQREFVTVGEGCGN
jgi:hypothetical protein